jgi:hypothetical protein
MEGGQNLAAPPVDIRQGTSAAMLKSLMRGASTYGMAAGGFSKVLYVPPLVQVKSSSTPNSDLEARGAGLVSPNPIIRKQPLTRRGL